MKRLQALCLIASASVLATPAYAQDLATAVTTKREMIVTANPLATAAGAKILKNGGTAVDAMVAAQVVLGLVEPQSSGLGGGAFAVYYDAATPTDSVRAARRWVRRLAGGRAVDVQRLGRAVWRIACHDALD